jgi:hypothetical protein
VSYTSPNPTGSLSFTPVANATGTAVITVTVSDGQVDNGSVSRAFRVTLNPVNDAPTISNIPDQSTPEDTPLTVTFTIGDSESLPQSLIVSATSANTSLVAVSNLLFNGSGSSRTLTVVPSPDQSGTSLITVFVTDGLLTNSDSFQLTVVSVNDQPTLNPIANFCTNAATGNPSFSIPLTGITSGAANESQTLNVTASSSAFLSSVSVSYTSPNPNATLTIRPPNNGTGSSTITVTVTDSGSGNNSIVRTFQVNIKASGNVLPTMSIIPTQNLAEDTFTNIAFTVRDVETSASSLTLSAFSSNQQLLPDASLVLGGSGNNRTIAITPVAQRSGTATVTLSVIDGSFGSSNMTFTVNVGAVNDPPTLTGIGAQTINDGTSTAPLAFSVSDVETPASQLQVTASSGNQTLVPNSGLSLGGSGTNRTLIVTPAPGQVGTATITVSVSDGAASTNTSFVLTVNAFNDPPTISSLPDQTIAVGGSTAALSVTVGDAETTAGSLTLTGSSSNTNLVPSSGFSFGGSGANRTVTITGAPGVGGTAQITLTLSDGTNQVNSIFNLNTLAVVGGTNTTPTLDAISNVLLSQNGPPRVVPLTGISGGPGDGSQAVILAASSSNPAIVPNPVINYASPSATGSLTLVAAPNASGSATITVVASDGQALNGSITRTFTATVNTAPVLSSLTNRVVNEDTQLVITFSATDAEESPANVTVNVTSSNASVLPPAGMQMSSVGANYTLTVLAATNQSGFTTLTVTATDTSGNSTVRAFLLTVTPVNDAPTLDALNPLFLSMNDGLQTVNLSGISSGAPNEVQALTVTASSSDPSVVPDPTVTYATPAATGSLSFTPVPNAAGDVTVTVTVRDDGDTFGGGVNLFARTFNVSVQGPPVLDIQPAAGQVVVSWTTNAGAGWVLQTNGVLSVSIPWAAGPAPSVVGGRYTVTNTLNPSMLFYRLRK